MKWRGIGSAPADETVIVWNGREVVAARWSGFDWRSEYDSGDREYGEEMFPQPSHWMPLPDPPRGSD